MRKILAITILFSISLFAECWNDSECSYDEVCECKSSSNTGNCDQVGKCISRKHIKVLNFIEGSNSSNDSFFTPIPSDGHKIYWQRTFEIDNKNAIAYLEVNQNFSSLKLKVINPTDSWIAVKGITICIDPTICSFQNGYTLRKTNCEDYYIKPKSTEEWIWLREVWGNPGHRGAAAQVQLRKFSKIPTDLTSPKICR